MNEAELVTSAQVVAATGVPYRRLHYWVTTGLVTPHTRGEGSGSRSLFHPDQVDHIRRLVQLTAAGVHLRHLRTLDPDSVVAAADRLESAALITLTAEAPQHDPTPDPPPAAPSEASGGRGRLLSSAEVVALAGSTYRRVDYLARTEVVVPVSGALTGSGQPRAYSIEDAVVVVAITKLQDELRLSLPVLRSLPDQLRGADGTVTIHLPTGTAVQLDLDAIRATVTQHATQPATRSPHRRPPRSSGTTPFPGLASNDKPHWVAPVQQVARWMAAHDELPTRRENLTLAKWVTTVRNAYANGRVPDEIVAALESIDGWSWTPTQRTPAASDRSSDGPRPDDEREEYQLATSLSKAERWLARLDELREFVAAEARPPRWRSEELTERSIAVWLGDQRRDHREGRLDPDQTAAISEVLPAWLESRSSNSLTRRTADYTAFVNTHDREPRQQADTAAERSLASWVSQTRQRFRAGQLTPDETAAIEQLPGWSWQASSLRRRWLDRLERWQAFHAAHGRGPSRSDDTELANWAQQQRRLHREEKLAPELIDLLDRTVGWTWSTIQRQSTGPTRSWSESLDALIELVDRIGRLPRPNADDPEERRLYGWLNIQTVRHQRGELTPTQTARLEKLPGWAPKAPTARTKWQDSFDHVKRFVDRTSTIPNTSNEPRLAAWCATQRSRYHHGELSGAAIAALEALPGWDWGTDTSSRPEPRPFNQPAAAYRAFLTEHHRRPRRRGATLADLDTTADRLAQPPASDTET